MSSFKEVFNPQPPDVIWQKTLMKLGAVMDKEIKQKGALEENLFAGIGVWEKI